MTSSRSPPQPTAGAPCHSDPGPDGVVPQAAINEDKRHPVRRAPHRRVTAGAQAARSPALRRRRADRRRLRRRSPRDAARSSSTTARAHSTAAPKRQGASPAADANAPRAPAARCIAAFDANKQHARAFWAACHHCPAATAIRASCSTASSTSTRRQGHASRRLRVPPADPRPAGLGGRLRRHRVSRSPSSTPGSTPPTRTSTGRVAEAANFTPDDGRRRRQRPRHARRPTIARQRRRLRRPAQGRRPGRRPADRQGARRRRLRRGLLGHRRHGAGPSTSTPTS